MINTSIKENFLDLFYHDIEDKPLEQSNKLNVFTLKVRNNSFAYSELIELLSNQLYHFALSRTEVQSLIDKQEYGTLISKTKSKFRNYKSNEGELGEVLLYCLLESHLGAPKILSKLELKTANNDYVKGADGVHLLKISEKDYQLILGESKLDADLRTGIYESFGSLANLIKNNKQKLDFEIQLVDSQLIKEAFNEDLYKLLKKIIIPSAKADEIYLDYSFGIFLGFDLDITQEELNKSNPEFRSHIRKKVVDIVEENIKSINYQIRKEEFVGYDFHIYIIPFSDLAEIRKSIIEDLTT